jgi:membrane-associated phospholipid phosphatase
MLKELQETIIYYDHIAWYYLNSRWHNAPMDWLMPFFRNQWFWVPLYFFLLLFMPSRFGKSGWLWCLAFFVTFVLSDQASATLLKPYFHRIRPCNDPYFASLVHIIVPCGSGQSFPSSHAANHFSLALFSAVSLSRFAKWILPVALGWALLVAYAQVYVGVHFPLDVVCGGLLGACIGYCTGKLFNRFTPLVLKPSSITGG